MQNSPQNADILFDQNKRLPVANARTATVRHLAYKSPPEWDKSRHSLDQQSSALWDLDLARSTRADKHTRALIAVAVTALPTPLNTQGL